MRVVTYSQLSTLHLCLACVSCFESFSLSCASACSHTGRECLSTHFINLRMLLKCSPRSRTLESLKNSSCIFFVGVFVSLMAKITENMQRRRPQEIELGVARAWNCGIASFHRRRTPACFVYTLYNLYTLCATKNENNSSGKLMLIKFWGWWKQDIRKYT